MKTWIVVIMAFVAAPSLAQQRDQDRSPRPSLPLREGIYSSAPCQGRPDTQSRIGYFANVLSPDGENQEGFCRVGRVTISGNVYAGSMPCESGTRISSPTGTYRFSYTILDNSAFVSRGKTYRWCAAHL